MEIKIETPVVEEIKPVVVETPIEVVAEKPVESRIETPIVETKPVVEETPVAPVVTEKPVEVKIETPAPVIVAPVTVVPEVKPAAPAPTDLQKDMQIIQNIQKETNQPPVTTAPIVVNTVAEMPKIPAANSLNLDDIKVDIPKIPAAPQIPGITTPPVITIPQNPYDNLQKIIPQIAPGTATVGHKGIDKAK